MYGAIVGDIAGSWYEGRDSVDKHFEMFGKMNRITDDTVMTVAIGEAFMFFLRDYYPNIYSTCGKSNNVKSEIIEEEQYEELKKVIVKNMVFWGNKFPNAGYGGRFRKWLRYNPKPYNSWGNGSAMRVSPVGWMFEDIETTRKMAAVQAEVSHNHPEGLKGAEAIATAIYLARKGESKEYIRQYVETEFGYDVSRTCNEIRPEYTFNVSCQGSVPEAIVAFLDSNDFEDAVRNAVSLGGDTDTIGAMAGSIAEAYYGVPEDLKEAANRYIPDIMMKPIKAFQEMWQ